MSVYFANQGALDLDVIRIMGVSVKMSDSPIGYFGTGLKFALATLLRNRQAVSLKIRDHDLRFETEPVEIRGETFDGIFMCCAHGKRERLPFTTQLGRNWDVWQAYRELYSNCLDEHGEISESPLRDETVFIVHGDAIDRAHRQRSSIFVQTQPLEVVEDLEIHPGDSDYIYYRGVRVGSFSKRTMLTYNITRPMDLTEDRTIADAWAAELAIESGIPLMRDKETLSQILDAPEEFKEHSLNYAYCHRPSKEFLELASRMANDANANGSLRVMAQKHVQDIEFYPACDTSNAHEETLRMAMDLAAQVGAPVSREEVTITPSLGPGVKGLYHKATGRIVLPLTTLDLGFRFTASTLYEEYLHKHYGLKDCSRALQNFLLDRLFAMADHREAA
jgi:hypothetical protein